MSLLRLYGAHSHTPVVMDTTYLDWLLVIIRMNMIGSVVFFFYQMNASCHRLIGCLCTVHSCPSIQNNPISPGNQKLNILSVLCISSFFWMEYSSTKKVIYCLQFLVHDAVLWCVETIINMNWCYKLIIFKWTQDIETITTIGKYYNIILQAM